jgi:uncharacterized protein (DUF849 family)
MLLKAAVNGGRAAGEHAGVPLTPDAIARASADAIAAGADVIHAHARTDDGAQTIDPTEVARLVTAVREAAPSAILGTTTGLWTCSGHEERMELVAGWPASALPDFASVAFCEEGAADAARLVLERGMILESAVWSLDDVPALLASPTLHSNVRILIEPEDDDVDVAIRHARAMADRIRAGGVRVPLLYHGYDETAWPLVRAAIEDGVETRVGFEDMLVLDDGSVPADTAAMVFRARALERAAMGSAATA